MPSIYCTEDCIVLHYESQLQRRSSANRSTADDWQRGCQYVTSRVRVQDDCVEVHALRIKSPEAATAMTGATARNSLSSIQQGLDANNRPSLFQQLDQAFGQGNEDAGRQNALQLLHMSKGVPHKARL